MKLDERADLLETGNFDKEIHGHRAARAGAVAVANLATVHLGMDVGLPVSPRRSCKLGLDEATRAKYPCRAARRRVRESPLEVAQMYNSLANGGFRSPLRAVRAVIDEQGKPLKAPQLEVTEAAPAEAVYTLDRMLIEVLSAAPAQSATPVLPDALVVAGKTGTSNDYRDSWFCRLLGGHLIVVWMGHDDNCRRALPALPVHCRPGRSLMSSIADHVVRAGDA